jgi:hypothetical protein
VLFRELFSRKEKKPKEKDRVLFFLSFFYVDVFLTKADGEKGDGIYTQTHTHTGGSVKRLLVVSDEQAAASKCAAEKRERKKNEKNIYRRQARWYASVASLIA